MLPSGEASKATAMGLCLEEARDLPVKERPQKKALRVSAKRPRSLCTFTFACLCLSSLTALRARTVCPKAFLGFVVV